MTQAHQSPDTVVVESPLPGGAASLVRYLANDIPSWLQMTGGAIIGAVALVAAVMLFRRRERILTWLRTRTRPIQYALAAATVVVIAGAAAGGAVTWRFMQHDNSFCTGCHVMKPAFQRFQAGDNKHGDLSCHDCHQQSMYASARQAYLWVAERPAEIGEHAKVPNTVCGKCHVTTDTARWQHVAQTAGHRIHLESDSSALRDVQCTKCHGVEVHRFLPVNETCGQSGCHQQKDTDIILGKMAGQTVLHCAGCHEFTADIPALATRDSAHNRLVPGAPQCLSCHAMQKRLGGFDVRRDPHKGKCGMCHNPHVQKLPSEAKNTCGNAGCHDTWKNEPFHSGPAHRKRAPDCLTCHLPHDGWKVDASDCQGCHQAVRSRTNLTPPLRFDTTKALRRGDDIPPDDEPSPGGDAPAVSEDNTGAPTPPASFPAQIAAQRADSFPHPRHTSLACITCHTNERGQGLTFEKPRGCFICHHQNPAPERCASCHQTAEYYRPIEATLSVTVPTRDARRRAVRFDHVVHSSRPCLECHTTPVSLAPPEDVRECRSCHDDHHAEGRACTSCHVIPNPAAAHTPLDAAHRQCDACHSGATVARLSPTRSFCAVCHTNKARTHYEPKECTTCHFLVDPQTFRRRLTKG